MKFLIAGASALFLSTTAMAGDFNPYGRAGSDASADAVYQSLWAPPVVGMDNLEPTMANRNMALATTQPMPALPADQWTGMGGPDESEMGAYETSDWTMSMYTDASAGHAMLADMGMVTDRVLLPKDPTLPPLEMAMADDMGLSAKPMTADTMMSDTAWAHAGAAHLDGGMMKGTQYEGVGGPAYDYPRCTRQIQDRCQQGS